MRCCRLPALLTGLALATVFAHTAAEGQPTEGPHEIHHIHGLAVDRGDPEVLYVATHTGLVRLRPKARPEWVGTHRFDLMGFTAHPTDMNVVFASGHPDAPTYRQEGVGNLGVLVSTDGGRSWRSVALKGRADFHALTYSPHAGGQLYGWSVAGQIGLYRISTGTWTPEQLPARGLSDVLALAASPDAAGPLLAGTATGLMMSRDGGSSWFAVKSAPAGGPATAVGYQRDDASVIYAYCDRSDLGLLRSRDRGETWERTGFFSGADDPVVALAAGPGDRVVVATLRANILRSRDGGRTWHRLVDRGRFATSP